MMVVPASAAARAREMLSSTVLGPSSRPGRTWEWMSIIERPSVTAIAGFGEGGSRGGGSAAGGWGRGAPPAAAAPGAPPVVAPRRYFQRKPGPPHVGQSPLPPQ